MDASLNRLLYLIEPLPPAIEDHPFYTMALEEIVQLLPLNANEDEYVRSTRTLMILSWLRGATWTHRLLQKC